MKLNYAKMMKAITLTFLLILGLFSTTLAQIPIPIGPQSNTFTSMVRGYHFTSPVNFTICGLYIPTNASTGAQNVEIVRFTSAPPPAFPGTTNAFTSLFYQNNYTTNAMIPCNVSVSTGDIMGIYGARAANMVNSYDGVNYVTTISGQNATLSRSGMQANLSTGQMANIWSETFYNIGRIIMYYNCCPTPPAPAGPITSNAGGCIGGGDTLTFTIPWDPQAVEYEWTVPSGDTIISGQGDSSITVVLGPNATTGQICVSMEDTCATGPSICYTYSSNQPSPAYAGPNRIICLGENTQLAAIAPSSGTGEWNYVSAPFNNQGVIVDPMDESTTFTTNQVGTHTLSWTVSSPGCPSNVDYVDINVIAQPEADFDFGTGCEGTPIAFTDESDGNGSPIGSYYWDMNNDGIYDHYGPNPSHSFVGSGIFQVTLVTTNLGCSDTVTKNVEVWAQPDVAFDTDPVCDGNEVEFDNLTSLNNSSLDSIIWNFADGTGQHISTAPNLNMNPDRLYPQSGSYVVTLTAVTDQGCKDSWSDTVKVYANPTASFTFDNACQFQTTAFNDQSTVSNADVVLWTWNLGDGGVTSNQPDPTHDYNSNGLVPVSLLVESNQGCTDDTVVQVEIFPSPQAQFNFSNNVCEGQETVLDQVSTIDYGSITSYEWLIIEDSITATGEQFVFTFPEAGSRAVQLTVTSAEGCSDAIQKRVPVFNTPKAAFVFDNACEDVEISFRDSTRFVDAIESYTWKFGDGSAWVSNQYPTHIYDTFGVYNVTFIVESHKGCIDSVTQQVEIYERVNPRFVVEQDSGCSPFYVELINKTVNQTGVDLTYKWTFKDDVQLIDTAYYTYIENTGHVRIFDITLDVVSSKGCESSYTEKDFITVLPQPLAFFTTDQDLSALRTTNSLVQFKNGSQQENKVFWDFGDGTTSRLQNPTHDYSYEGVYEITLVAENFLGCVDTFRMNAEVSHENRPLVPTAFTPNGDGLNDVFGLYGLQDVTKVKIEIFDRWGNLVFSAEGKDATWDGTDNQSRIVQQGAYPYRIVYEDAEGAEHEFQGNVTVLGVNR